MLRDQAHAVRDQSQVVAGHETGLIGYLPRTLPHDRHEPLIGVLDRRLPLVLEQLAVGAI